MPVTVESLRTTPYSVDLLSHPLIVDHGAPPPPAPALAPGAAVPAPNAVRYGAHHHVSYPWQSCRGNLAERAPTVGDARRHLRVNRATVQGVGNTIYLPFTGNTITSMRLPPPPAGVTLFITDGMSGCKFFVDTIGGSNDVVVYHANTTQFGPAQNDYADIQRGEALTLLDQMRTDARTDYPGPALAQAAACAKPQYFAVPGQRERTKEGAGRGITIPPGSASLRTRPEFLGGTTVVGFPVAGAWQFWYQTYGDLSYERPTGAKKVAKAVATFHWNYIHKRIWSKNRHQASWASIKVVACSRVPP